MPESRKKTDKKLSLHPLTFEDALKGLLATEPHQKRNKRRRHQRNDVLVAQERFQIRSIGH